MANMIDRGGPPPYYLLQEQAAGGWRDLSRHSSIDEALRHLAEVTRAYRGQKLRLLDARLDAATGALAYVEALSIDPGQETPADPATNGDAPPDQESGFCEALGHDDDQRATEALVSSPGQGEQWREDTGGRPPSARVSWPARARLVGAGRGAAVALTIFLGVSAAVAVGAIWLAQNPGGIPAFPLLAQPVPATSANARPGSADLMFGHDVRWRLTEAKAAGLPCQRFGLGLIGCEIESPEWPPKAMTFQLGFDERSERLAGIRVVSELLTDSTARRDGALIRQRIDRITREIADALPQGSAPTRAIEVPRDEAFWESLRADTGSGMYYIGWPDRPGTGSPAVTLRLFGLDSDRGFYKLLVEPAAATGSP